MDAFTTPRPASFDPARLREELTSDWLEIPHNADQARARVLRRLKALKTQAQSEARDFLGPVEIQDSQELRILIQAP